MADRPRSIVSRLTGSRRAESEILVIGLGRFGSSLAHTLIDMGYEVLGVDTDAVRVQEHADALTHVVEADCTTERALRQIGASDIKTAVVCIGSDVESSVLTTVALVDLGIPNIWAKAITKPHGTILERVGAHHVVFPEAEMGARVAHLLTGRMMEYFALDDSFVLVETTTPPWLVDVPLAATNLRARFNITVVCVKHQGQPFTYATSETTLGSDDLIVVAGHRVDVERFAEEASTSVQ